MRSVVTRSRSPASGSRVPDLRTTITEVVTGLAMFGAPDLDTALQTLTAPVENVSPELWANLRTAWNDRVHEDAFDAAWANGVAFLAAKDGLRKRRALVVEWKGPHKAPGDEVVPADLRIDHVYQVSCKYLSRIVVNASPSHLFERLLTGGHGQRSPDWFQHVAPQQLGALYECARRAVDGELPERVEQLTGADRRQLSSALKGAWTPDAAAAYEDLVATVAKASTDTWLHSMGDDAERMLWRLLRIGSAPYFVLGTAATGHLRLRIATPWDWRQRFSLKRLVVEPRPAGQPTVSWRAVVREKATRRETAVDGHVEVRWSHGRFCGPPEAKVYLDTPHADVPGYFALV
jgi:hypothetical protein